MERRVISPEWTTALPPELWHLILSFVPWMRRTCRLIDRSLAEILAADPPSPPSSSSGSHLVRLLTEIRWLNAQEDFRLRDWPSSKEMMEWSLDYLVHWYELDPSVHLPFMRAVRLDLIACEHGRVDLLPWFKAHTFPKEDWILSLLRGHRVTTEQLTVWASGPITTTFCQSVLQAAIDSARRDYWEWYLRSDWLMSSEMDGVVTFNPVQHARSALEQDPSRWELTLLDEILTFSLPTYGHTNPVNFRTSKRQKLSPPTRPSLELFDPSETKRLDPFLERDRWDVLLGLLMMLRSSGPEPSSPLSRHRFAVDTRKLTRYYFSGSESLLFINGKLLAEMTDRNVMPCWCCHLYILARIWNTPSTDLKLDARSYMAALVRQCIRQSPPQASSWDSEKDCGGITDFLVQIGQPCLHTPSFDTLLDWLRIGKKSKVLDCQVYCGYIFRELCSNSYSRPSDDHVLHGRWEDCFRLFLSAPDIGHRDLPNRIQHACRSGDVTVMKLLLEKVNLKKYPQSNLEAWYELLDPSVPVERDRLVECAALLEPNLSSKCPLAQFFHSPQAPERKMTFRNSRAYWRFGNESVGLVGDDITPWLMTLRPLVQSVRPQNALIDWMLSDDSPANQWFGNLSKSQECMTIMRACSWFATIYHWIERRELFKHLVSSTKSAVCMKADQWLGYMFMHRRLLAVVKVIYTRQPWSTLDHEKWTVMEAMRYAFCNGFVPMVRNLLADDFWKSVLDRMDQRAWSEDDWRTRARSWCALFGQTEMLTFMPWAGPSLRIFCLSHPKMVRIVKWSERSGIRVTLRLPSKTQMFDRDDLDALGQMHDAFSYMKEIFEELAYDHEWVDIEHLHREWSIQWTGHGTLYEIHPLNVALQKWNIDQDPLHWCARQMDLKWFADCKEVEKFREAVIRMERPPDLSLFAATLLGRISSCTLPIVDVIKRNLSWLPGF